jgi:hypothetical protein
MLNLTADQLVAAYQDACVELHLLRSQNQALLQEIENLHAQRDASVSHTHPHEGGHAHNHDEQSLAKP